MIARIKKMIGLLTNANKEITIALAESAKNNKLFAENFLNKGNKAAREIIRETARMAVTNPTAELLGKNSCKKIGHTVSTLANASAIRTLLKPRLLIANALTLRWRFERNSILTSFFDV